MSGAWPAEPVVYELNTAAWLHDVGARAGRPAALGSVPDAEWAAVTPEGVDAVWLMGVWQRSPVGVELARPNEEASWHEVLPDLTDADVIGSAVLHPQLRRRRPLRRARRLAAARAALAGAGQAAARRLRAETTSPRTTRGSSSTLTASSRGPPDALATDPAAFIQVGSSIVAAGATRTSPRGPMSLSSTRSPRRCGAP
jgi:hypothetical protein